jgi:hypothetical protein
VRGVVCRFLGTSGKHFPAGEPIFMASFGLWARAGKARAARNRSAIRERMIGFMVGFGVVGVLGLKRQKAFLVYSFSGVNDKNKSS